MPSKSPAYFISLPWVPGMTRVRCLRNFTVLATAHVVFEGQSRATNANPRSARCEPVSQWWTQKVGQEANRWEC